MTLGSSIYLHWLATPLGISPASLILVTHQSVDRLSMLFPPLTYADIQQLFLIPYTP